MDERRYKQSKYWKTLAFVGDNIEWATENAF